MLLRGQQTATAAGVEQDLAYPGSGPGRGAGSSRRRATTRGCSTSRRARCGSAGSPSTSGRRTHDPVSGLHEHLAGGVGSLVALGDVFIPLRDVLDEAAKGLGA